LIINVESKTPLNTKCLSQYTGEKRHSETIFQESEKRSRTRVQEQQTDTRNDATRKRGKTVKEGRQVTLPTTKATKPPHERRTTQALERLNKCLKG